MAPLFSLPNELRISALCTRFPCREQQIRSLATLLSIRGAATRNLVLHGLEATGKSAITKAVLEELSAGHSDAVNGDTARDTLQYAIVRSAECIGARHLLEQTVGAVATALEWEDTVGRCENISQLVVGLGRLVGTWSTGEEDENRRFVLVFDGIDRQRDAPPTLLPALARLGEIIPNLTTIFIITSPRPHFLHLPGTPHIAFSSYTKPELLTLLALTPPDPLLSSGEKETLETYSRFCPIVYDSLSKYSGRDVLSLKHVCLALWPRFIRPVLAGEVSATPFSKLLIATRSLFQDESVLTPSMTSLSNKIALQAQKPNQTTLSTLLPRTSRILLVAAYLASYSPQKNDTVLYMRASLSRRRKKGGGTALSRVSKTSASKSRKIARKLLGPQAFGLERMMAIFWAVRGESSLSRSSLRSKRKGRGERDEAGSADMATAIATLGSLRLLSRVGSPGGADSLDGNTRFRVAVGWEVVRSIGRSVGVEMEEYLLD